jgi:hypothetical protein
VIQTGPGVPNWSWRTITFGWDGPVSSSQTVRPILIPPHLSRPLGVVRILCLVLLAAMLLSQKREVAPPVEPTPEKEDGPGPNATPAAALVALSGLLLFAFASPVQAQFPNRDLLEELKKRLTETPDTFPGAADLASADLKLEGQTFTLTLPYHAADRCAVPVPVTFSALVPESAAFGDGKPATALRRDGHLWVLLPSAGIHELTVKGRLRDLTEWEWGFPLKPRRVSVSAEGWTVSGLRPDGTAEDEVLFARVRREEAAAATYDRPETKHAPSRRAPDRAWPRLARHDHGEAPFSRRPCRRRPRAAPQRRKKSSARAAPSRAAQSKCASRRTRRKPPGRVNSLRSTT